MHETGDNWDEASTNKCNNGVNKGEQKLRRKLTLIILALIIIATLQNIPKTQAAEPVVAVISVYDVTEPGKTFLVNINITGATNLLTWVVNLTWDPDVIKITTGDPDPNAYGAIKKGKYNIYEGPFLKSIGVSIFTANKIDNTLGQINSLAATLTGTNVSASGDGTLVTINFTSVSVNTTTIDINGPSTAYPGQSVLVDITAGEIPHKDRDGIVTERGPPPPQIWTQLWFQVTLGVIVVIPVAAVVAKVYIRHKKWVAEHPPEREEDIEQWL